MSDEKALLAAIWEHPHEDTPRLMYADWLQENGQSERAEFIRLQCAIAELAWDDPARAEPEQRAAVLQKKHGGKWKADLPRRLRSVRYSRGFPQPSRKLGPSDLDAIPAFEWNAVPLWNVSLTRHDAGTLNALAASPKLLRIGSLWLDPGRKGKQLDQEGTTALVRSPHARNLAMLDFSTRLQLPTLEAILASPTLRNLRDLSFHCCGLYDDVIHLLMKSAVPERLTGLGLAGNHYTCHDLQPFFEGATRFVRLRSLGLDLKSHPSIPPLEFASFGPLPALRTLHAPTDGELIALTKWPGLATVRRLSLHGGKGIGLEEARALVASPHLHQLRSLSCGFDPDSQEETINLLKSHFTGCAYLGG